jgi:lysophospholipase L1-like esterase
MPFYTNEVEREGRARSRERRAGRGVRDRIPHRESSHNRRARRPTTRRRSRESTRSSLPTSHSQSEGAHNRRRVGEARRVQGRGDGDRDHGVPFDLRDWIDIQKRYKMATRGPRGGKQSGPRGKQGDLSITVGDRRAARGDRRVERGRDQRLDNSQEKYRSDIHHRDSYRQKKGDHRAGGRPHARPHQEKRRVKGQKKVSKKLVRPQDKKLVMLLGHSQLRNLFDLADSPHKSREFASLPLRTNFDLNEIYCHWRVRSGLKIKDMGLKEFDMLDREQPKILYIQLADNDLGSNDLPRNVAQMAVNVARIIVDDPTSSVKLVIISKALPREGTTVHMKVSLTRFNRKVEAFNTFLQDELMSPWGKSHEKVEPRSFTDPRIWVWDHRRFGPRLDLKRDGVHLNEKGERALYYSIRGALQIALQPEWDV